MSKIEKAVELFKNKEYGKALDIFCTIVENGEETAEICNNIGLCYVQLGNFEKAEDNFVNAIKLNPKLPQIYINLADLYYKAHDYDSGIQLLSQGIYELPDEMILVHFLARFYMEDARLDLAIDELEKILEKQPENYDAYYDLGKVHFELGDYALAADNFENVLEHKKDNEWIYYYLGEAYEANDEVDKALSSFLRAIAVNESFHPAYKKAAILFLARQEYEDAIEYFEDYKTMKIPDEEKENIQKLIENMKKKLENEK